MYIAVNGFHNEIALKNYGGPLDRLEVTTRHSNFGHTETTCLVSWLKSILWTYTLNYRESE